MAKTYNLKLNEDELRIVNRTLMSFWRSSKIIGDKVNEAIFDSLSEKTGDLIHANKLCRDPNCDYESYKAKRVEMAKKAVEEGN